MEIFSQPIWSSHPRKGCPGLFPEIAVETLPLKLSILVIIVSIKCPFKDIIIVPVEDLFWRVCAPFSAPPTATAWRVPFQLTADLRAPDQLGTIQSVLKKYLKRWNSWKPGLKVTISHSDFKGHHWHHTNPIIFTIGYVYIILSACLHFTSWCDFKTNRFNGWCCSTCQDRQNGPKTRLSGSGPTSGLCLLISCSECLSIIPWHHRMVETCWNPINHGGIKHLSTGAGFCWPTVWRICNIYI